MFSWFASEPALTSVAHSVLMSQ